MPGTVSAEDSTIFKEYSKLANNTLVAWLGVQSKAAELIERNRVVK
jgi:hypothetical protein